MTPSRVEESTEAWWGEIPDFSSEPKDWRSPSIHSAPLEPWNCFAAEDAFLNEWSFEKEERRLKNRPDDAFYRGLRQDLADKRAECQKEAEALGFSSWEAMERHHREENRKRLKEYFEEHGHLPPPPTMTEEQRVIFERRQERQREAERELLKPPCQCLDHVAWWFCPERLRSYKSQGNEPSDFLYLQALHPTDLNVHVEEGDPSKRVPERWLEYRWAMPSPSKVLHLPLWAKWDDVVQDMINREEVDKTLYYGDPELQKKPPPPRRTVSSSVSSCSDSEVEGNAERLGAFESRGLQKESAAGLNLKQSLPKDTTDVDMTLASPPAEISTGLSRSGSHSARKPPSHGHFQDISDLGVHETESSDLGVHEKDASDLGVHEKDASDLGVHETTTTRVSQAQSYKINKRRGAKKEATRKTTLSDRIQTHAQEVLNFLAGDSGACATSLSHH